MHNKQYSNLYKVKINEPMQIIPLGSMDFKY